MAKATAKNKNMGIAVGSIDDLLEATMSPARRAQAQKRADAILQRMRLDQLRKDRRMTQVGVAAAMHIQQSEVSRIEKRAEVKMGTVREYVRALGGHVEVRAVFPDKSVELSIAE